MPHWGVRGGFYDQAEDLNRARKEHLEDSITILAWIATIDGFQHWMYRNPKHTHAQRDAHWLALDDRFGHDSRSFSACRTRARTCFSERFS